jgi:2-polyprenyl-6-hydroxyphenyl methylase/3-demethylubiquinone-9 3-methyltransferase
VALPEVASVSATTKTSASVEIAVGARFAFGRNWKRYSRGVTEDSIEQAEASLTNWLSVDRLNGSKFLDVGCGSGLFSLAARRLGATVHSFDYDPDSVQCTLELRHKWRGEDPAWTVEVGSVLDRSFIERLGKYDIVYSYGVLHHTGDLWRALDNVAIPVKPEGMLWLAVYNDQAWKSRVWRRIKRFYVSGFLGKLLVSTVFIPYWIARGGAADLLRLRNPISRYRRRSDARGMWLITDWLDWLGGYPFEVATPEAVFDFYFGRGFTLTRLRTVGGRLGNNWWLFVRQ